MIGVSTILMLLSFSVFSADISYKGEVAPFLKEQVHEVLSLLPQDYLSSVKSVKIAVASIKYEGQGADLCSRGSFGEANRFTNTITISQRLVEQAETNDKFYPCAHGTFLKTLRATLIHELTHLKDRAEKLSVNADFQRTVGIKRVQGTSLAKVMNSNSASSPDAYEFKNLEESLAVNAERFFLDEAFECRKPATSRVLARLFKTPLKERCERNDEVLLQSSFLEENYTRVSTLDPSRIYQVHYLFAGKGKQLMSNWGHAMLRLIVCAPTRPVASEDCFKDVSHHVVLTYRAFVEDLKIDQLKGLLGMYPSQLFIVPFHEVQQEYTKFDFRELFSLPVKLSDEQKRDVLELALERYWTYEGKYFFLSNNCGSEVDKHLSYAFSDEQSRKIKSLTPERIYQSLINEENDLAGGEFERLSKQELRERNLYFPSMYEEYRNEFQVLKDTGVFTQQKFDDFLKTTKATSRLQRYQTFFTSDEFWNLDFKKRQRLLLKAKHLERYLNLKTNMSFPEKLLRNLQKEPGLKKKFKEMAGGIKTLTMAPWNVIQSEYGVPSSDEIKSQHEVFLKVRKSEVKKSLNAQIQEMRSLLGKPLFEEDKKEFEALEKATQFLTTIPLSKGAL